jgi:hypothetical protein
MLTLGTTIKTIKEHFSDAQNQYQIPIYQRRYEWGTEQVDALLNDIIEHLRLNPAIDLTNAAGPANLLMPKYLIGSIFLYKAKYIYETPEIFIIDGQQRITTITLIAMVLRKKIQESLDVASADPAFDQKFINNYITSFITPIEELYKFPINPFAINVEHKTKIKVTHEVDFYHKISTLDFSADIPGNIITNRFIKNINTIKYSLEKYEGVDYPASIRLNNLCILAGALMNYTNMAVIVAESPSGQIANHTEVINIFSKINARGKDLSQSDLLKVDFLQGENANNNGIANQWDTAFENVEPIEIDSYFTLLYAARNLEFPKTISDAWSALLRGMTQQQKNAILMEQVFPLFSARHEVAFLAHESLPLLRELGFNEWQAIVYWVRINNIPTSDLILKKLLNVCFCLTVLGSVDKTRRKILKEIFWNPADEEDNQAYSTLVRLAISRLDEESLYFFSAARKKFTFHFIDRVLNGSVGAVYDHAVAHIEHVLPQNSERWTNNDGWTPELIGVWTQKIGNLVLLPARINIQASNLPFSEKVLAIQAAVNVGGHNINAYGLRFIFDDQTLGEINWNPDYVKERHKKIIDKIKDRLNSINI